MSLSGGQFAKEAGKGKAENAKDLPMTTTKDRTLAAAGLIAVYAFIIGFTDNYVRVIADEAGLWQFHFTRSCMTAVLLGIGAAIWVLLISRFAYGHQIGPVRIIAVAIGFVGVILVLGPEALGGASLAAILPIAAGALYALGNIATREWCGQESAQTLLAGFFGALGIIGALGMLALTLFPLEVPAGADGFLQRGPVWASGQFYFWTFVQAAGSLLGVGFMIRAYQITDASRASVLEYVILPASAFWTWVIWGKGLEPLAVLGMVLIVVAGSIIALRARAQEAVA